MLTADAGMWWTRFSSMTIGATPGLAAIYVDRHDDFTATNLGKTLAGFFTSEFSSSVLETKYVDEAIVVDGNVDAVIEALRLHLQSRTYSEVIIADDPLLNALAERSAEEPWIREILPLQGDESLDILSSKIAFLDRCREYGLPIAQSENVSNRNEGLRAAARISYPVMLKLSTGHGGNGVKRIDASDLMLREFDAFALGRSITVERFIVGRVGGCEALFDHGRPVCWSPFLTYRGDTEFGASTVRMLFAHPKLADIVEKLGALTKFHGFGVLDFIHDEVRDELVLLALNFRPGPGTHMRGRIRKMFAAGFVSTLRGKATDGRQTHGLHGQVVALFPQDVHRAISPRDPWSLVCSMLQGRFLPDVPFDDLPLLARHLRDLTERFVRPLRTAMRVRKAEPNRILAPARHGREPAKIGADDLSACGPRTAER